MITKHYPGTDLDRTIPKSANAKEMRRTRIKVLAEQHGIDAQSLKLKDPSPWRILCLCVVLRHIRGFQVSGSGRKKEQSFLDDFSIYAQFDPASARKYTPHLFTDHTSADKGKSIKALAKEHKCSEGKIRAKIDRAKSVLKEYPDAFYDVDFLVYYPLNSFT